jgi:hypothetical protein
LYNARASINRWVSPPENSTPSSYTSLRKWVSYCFGRLSIFFVMPAFSAQAFIFNKSMSLSVCAMFSATVVDNSEKSWNTAEKWR